MDTEDVKKAINYIKNVVNNWDVDKICAKLVEIVMQEYSELYSDDVPKIFLHNLFERFKYYLNEA